MQRKVGASPKSPIVWKATADEMIGVPVPRKARSVSTKRSSHEWSGPCGGSGGGACDSSQIQRPSSRPISSASASTTAPARKKLKPVGGGRSSGVNNFFSVSWHLMELGKKSFALISWSELEISSSAIWTMMQCNTLSNRGQIILPK